NDLPPTTRPVGWRSPSRRTYVLRMNSRGRCRMRVGILLRTLASTGALTGALAGASVAGAQSASPPPVVNQGGMSPADLAKANHGIPPFSKADVDFMSGMIGHHAQAVVMGGWAPTHGASKAVQTLCARIVVAQTDEIASMQRWLRDRNLPVPDAH